MMQWALRKHPHLWGSAESDFLVPLLAGAGESYKRGSTRGKMHWLQREWVSEQEYLRWIGLGINAMYTNRSRGLTWVEQTPQYTLHLAGLTAMFPGARFVGMVRDGRDVVASLRNFVEPMSHRSACREWVSHTEALLAHVEDHPESLLLVRYEEVVSDTAEALDRIFGFLRLDPSSDSANFIRNEPPINSSFDSPRGPDPRWAVWSKSERDSFAAVAGGLLSKLGYVGDHGWLDTPPLETGGAEARTVVDTFE